MRIPPECDFTDRGGTKREATELVNPQIWWQGCYKQARSADDPLMTAESVAHPAKLDTELLQRIRRFGEERGWWKPGDTVLDNFYGIGTTGLLRLSGYNVVGVELEPKFVEMAEENAAILDRKAKAGWLKKLGWGKVIQGDSRKLTELLGIEAEAAVLSPPYADTNREGKCDIESRIRKLDAMGLDGKKWLRRCSDLRSEGYGESEGQIANLPDAAVTSPPYGQVMERNKPQHPNIQEADDVMKKLRMTQVEYGESEGQIGSLPDAAVTSPPWGEQSHYQIYDESKGFHSYDENEAKNRMKRDYIAGQEEGQIGNLPDGAVTSPPYGQVMQRNKREHPNIQQADDEMKKLRMGQVEYGKSKEQIGSLPDAAVTSPPYGGTMGQSYDGDVGKWIEREEHYQKQHPDFERPAPLAYSGDPGNIENLPEESAHWQRSHRYKEAAEYPGHTFGENTYQGAMLSCYQELHCCLKPGGVACIVTKNPTRDGKLRRLDIDTATLLLMAAFDLWCPICEDWDGSIHDHPDPDLEPVTGYRAVLAQEHRQPTLFGQTETFLKGRTSFFKRLSWRKGSPIALWEDVIFARA